jgi:hypothetical protein
LTLLLSLFSEKYKNINSSLAITVKYKKIEKNKTQTRNPTITTKQNVQIISQAQNKNVRGIITRKFL